MRFTPLKINFQGIDYDVLAIKSNASVLVPMPLIFVEYGILIPKPTEQLGSIDRMYTLDDFKSMIADHPNPHVELKNIFAYYYDSVKYRPVSIVNDVDVNYFMRAPVELRVAMWTRDAIDGGKSAYYDRHKHRFEYVRFDVDGKDVIGVVFDGVKYISYPNVIPSRQRSAVLPKSYMRKSDFDKCERDQYGVIIGDDFELFSMPGKIEMANELTVLFNCQKLTI